jgi:hypothetical protein
MLSATKCEVISGSKERRRRGRESMMRSSESLRMDRGRASEQARSLLPRRTPCQASCRRLRREARQRDRRNPPGEHGRIRALCGRARLPRRRRSSYGQIIKEFDYNAEGERRYSPPKLIGSKKAEIFGTPEFDRIGTSRVERCNLSLRTGMKRMSRLTIAFSRCWRNHRAAMALWIGYFNFCKMHRSIKTTPAMKADVARKPWSMRERTAAAVGA